jgi:hypothetical protein
MHNINTHNLFSEIYQWTKKRKIPENIWVFAIRNIVKDVCHTAINLVNVDIDGMSVILNASMIYSANETLEWSPW